MLGICGIPEGDDCFIYMGHLEFFPFSLRTFFAWPGKNAFWGFGISCISGIGKSMGFALLHSFFGAFMFSSLSFSLSGVWWRWMPVFFERRRFFVRTDRFTYDLLHTVLAA